MRGETVAEGGRKHACPVGVSKIRARRSVESLLKRPLAEILSSTAPAVVLVKEESRRSTAPVAKEVSRRRKPHRSMWLHARLVDASTARYLLVRVPQRQGSQNRDRLDHGLLTSRPRLAATGITPRACALPYIHITAVWRRAGRFFHSRSWQGMGSPAPLLDRSSCATWGTESPGSAWGISTPKAEREFELDHNLPSGSWAGRGASDDSPGPAGCAYDPPSKRAAAYEGADHTFELACEICTGCGFVEPFARDLDSGDPYCKDCWCAKGPYCLNHWD